MELTMGLPTFTPRGRKEELAWYRRIDEGPWTGLATYDRIIHPVGWAIVPQLAAAAAMTERVRLWTSIAIPNLRNAVLFAKDLATIDVLSGGRLTLGIGIGAYDEDYLAVGCEPALKRQRMDAQVATMRRIWAQEPPTGERLAVGPRPLQPGGPPIVAGVRGPNALSRAAQWAIGVGDGNSAFVFDPEDLAAQRERVVQAWRNAGRGEKPHFSAGAYFALGPRAQDQFREHLRDFMGHSGGTADPYGIADSPNPGRAGLLAIVRGARAAGLDSLRLVPTTADPDEIDRARDVLGL
jgi:alkanesulfonate monooxygenase SsuD/methylene tetrahydromethanopterin reductase-like flavin-dependent oxidoreductase (luciferase family)